MYQWDLLDTPTGCRLVIGRPGFAIGLICVLAFLTALSFGYCLWHADFTSFAIDALGYAFGLIIAAGISVWCWRYPDIIVFSGDFNVRDRTIVFSQKALLQASKTSNHCFANIRSIDTTLVVSIPEESTQAISLRGVQFVFSDGLILRPVANQDDPTGKIEALVSMLRDLTGIPGEAELRANNLRSIEISVRTSTPSSITADPPASTQTIPTLPEAPQSSSLEQTPP